MLRMSASAFALLPLMYGCETTTPSAPDVGARDGGPDATYDASWHPDAQTIDPDVGIDAGGDASIDANFTSDTAIVDAALDTGPACSPGGTYTVTWTQGSSNPSGCLTPSNVVQLGDDGLSGSGLRPCSGHNCTATNCTNVGVTSASCTTTLHFVGTCNDAPDGETYDATTTFHAGGTLDITVTQTRVDSSVCHFTATGARN